eukprot:TRINITY_DN13446_c0_g1_i1.p1 TRINITY_DN13446_c0_g1~~TRINITY_DN13446_c0_g1_i1.p1  ORF type:complete len:112 (-),score=27.71 TRINITY_DN13446_c0_g1_i1:130-432(-)
MSSFVQETISQNPVVIFSKTYCPYCHRAIDLFKSINANAKVIQLDERDDGEKIFDHLKEITGARTVPRVFIGGKFVGGCDAVVALQSQGKLEEKVREARN